MIGDMGKETGREGKNSAESEIDTGRNATQILVTATKTAHLDNPVEGSVFGCAFAAGFNKPHHLTLHAA